MQIRIAERNLCVLKSSFSELEKELFEDLVPEISEQNFVVDDRYTCNISGFKSELFDLLIMLSYRFDIELL